MASRAVIELIKSDNSIDEYGDTITTPSYRKIFADELSISTNEFYYAAQTDFKPSVKFKIYKAEYHGELKIKYNGSIYNIIRSFPVGLDFLEITGEGDV